MREQLQNTLGAAYTIERELDGGGMSRVYVALETALGRQVVVKVLPHELVAGVNVERFKREILLAARLQHPNIVPLLNAGETEGLPYYTMPFVEGQSLRVRITESGALSISDAIFILRDVAKALAYAHERGIVHRDIKPDNVLLTSGTATVTDFGIAKALSVSRGDMPNADVTQVGISIGTPTYMAPEQAAADPSADHRADIYSFGCMAYELLAGQPPFTGMSPRKLMAAHAAEVPRKVTDLRADVPRPLADLVMQCLEKDPDQRPQTAAGLVRTLENATGSGSFVAVPEVLLNEPVMFRRALAVYAAAFVIVAAAAKAAIMVIGLPDWVFPGALILMAVVLPGVLWTGYARRVSHRTALRPPRNTPGGTPAVSPNTLATMALRAAPRLSWYRTARGGALALGAFIVVIVAFMAMRALGIGPPGTLLASGRLKAREPLVMTDFSVTRGDTSLARVVSFAVRTVLAQSPVLTIVDQSAVAAMLTQMDRPRNQRMDLALAQGVALREGAKAIVDGDVTAVGTGYVLTLRLVSADSSRVLAAFQAGGDGPQGLIEAADKVARDLRAKAGESLRSVQNAVPLYRARTASLDALRFYSEGSFANNVELDRPKAVRLLRQAVAIDSTFAEGWRRLGITMNNLAMPRAAVDSALGNAYRFRSKLSAEEQALIEASYYARGPGRDRAKAIAAYERAMKFDRTLSNNLGAQYATRREFARADSMFRIALATDSTFVLAYRGLGFALVDEGRLDAADSLLRIALRRFPKNNAIRLLAVQQSYYRGDLDGYQRQLDSARATPDPTDPSWALYRSAEMALLHGQLGKWRALRAQGLSADSTIGRRPSRIESAAVQAIVTANVRGEASAEAGQLDSALASTPLRTLPDAERPDLLVARSLGVTGRPAAARAVIRDYEATLRDTAIRRSDTPALHTALGAVALAEQKPADAIVEFRRGDSGPDGPATSCSLCLPAYLGRAFDMANQRDSTIAQYEKYIATPQSLRTYEEWDPSLLAGIHERLGQLYALKGNAMKSAAHDRAFVELWKNADAELQPRVAAARARLRKTGALR